MATIHNTFIRKFGDMAVVITITDWNDFKELEKFAEKESSSDFLVQGTTTKSIYSNMQPTMQINTYAAKDVSKECHGMGIDGIITGSIDGDPFWGFKKSGLTVAEEFSK